MKLQKIAGILFIIFLVVLILIKAQSIILPLILAIILWFLIKEFREFMDKSHWIKTKIKKWVKTIVATVFLILILGLVTSLLIQNANKLSGALPKYSMNLDKIAQNIESSFGFNISEKVNQYSGELDFQSLIRIFLDSVSELFSNAFMILLYLLFLLMEESTFSRKLKAIYSTPDDYEKINNLLYKIDFSLGKYIAIKTLLSLITAILSYIALLALGIDFAIFWAFCIFILNYIPSIGSLIATIFPAIMALIQYGGSDFMPFFYVLILVGFIQLFVGNFLEPKMMGNSLNISSLVVILSLSVWGVIWGVVGMVLSVPITVMMIIVFSNFESTKKIAILLSEKGIINGSKTQHE
ncbi:MAG: AI-2E family transporter [Flavobacteriales bacterium]